MRFQPKILFTLFLILLLSFAVFIAKDFAFAGRLFPVAIGIPALILSLIQLVLDFRVGSSGYEASSQDFTDIAPDSSITLDIVRKRGIRFLLWFIAMYLGIWVLGFKIAIPIFFIAFLWFEGNVRWFLVVLLSALSGFAIYCFGNWLSVFWPKPLLSKLINLGWLF